MLELANLFSIAGILIGVPNIKQFDSHSLRIWWHNILGEHGKYACYAIFIGLPSDTEIIDYLLHSALELGYISGNNCLVMALSDVSFVSYEDDSLFWWVATQDNIESGNSLKIAELFDIGFDEMPCVVFFRDIRLSEHVTISLRNMKVDAISEKMRSLFTVIQKSVAEKKDPLSALTKQQVTKKRKRAVAKLGEIAGKFSGQALETLMKTWIEVNVK